MSVVQYGQSHSISTSGATTISTLLLANRIACGRWNREDEPVDEWEQLSYVLDGVMSVEVDGQRHA